jgi:4-hydroxy-tetrahydrodipicolinate synthase
MVREKREVWAAMLTHRDPAGSVEREAAFRNAAFLAEAGMDGIVLNGATGEYTVTTPAEFRDLLTISTEAVRGRCALGACIGAGSLEAAVDLGQAAFAAGISCVLLPPPHFFRYSQDDIASWSAEIANRLPGPVLLYNLPQFTNELESATVQSLVATGSRIVGIKDSSGSLEILRSLTNSGLSGVKRFIGNDVVLVRAFREGICDGVVSGVAGVLPELISFLANESAVDQNDYDAAILLLNEYIDQIQRFPVPWGLKWTAQYRGLASANFAQPQSTFRREQSAAFLEWLNRWWSRAESVVTLVPVASSQVLRT